MRNANEIKIDRLAYRIPETAMLLDVSVPMVYKMIRNRELQTIRVGSVMRVTRASLLRLVGESDPKTAA